MRPSFSRRARPALASVLAALAVGLGACSTLSVQQEQALHDDFLLQVRREVDLLTEPVVVGYVDGIGRAILRHAPPQPFHYDFYVIQDDSINAFAGPAGQVFVNTGTILKARNLSELAGVIAHEIGHVAERHVAQNIARQRTAGLLHKAAVYGTAIVLGGPAANAVNLGGGLATLGVLNTFGREAEREADAFAVDALVQAGIDPMGLVTFFELLEREDEGGVPEFLSSHPAPAERVRDTRTRVEAIDRTGLRTTDGGRLEIIQRRIRLLTHRPR
jgi:predicted Zn-dependent protease